MKNCMWKVTAESNYENKFRRIKIMSIILILILLMSFWALHQKKPIPSVCIYDKFHEFTTKINRQFNTNQTFRFFMMVSGQLLIDVSLIAVFIIFITKFRNFSPIAWAACFYLFRSFLLNIYKMPFPEGMYWAEQGIPTVGVPYQYTRDFFYSGHTGFMIYSVQTWRSYNCKPMLILSIVGLVQAIILLIISRGHYIIDICGGWIFSEWFSLIIHTNIRLIDEVLSKIILRCAQTWNSVNKKLLKQFVHFSQRII